MNTETKSARIYLKTPAKKWLWRGGMAACVLPLFSGILLALFFILADRLMQEDFTPENINYTSSLIFMMIPITGALIAAYLGTREIKNKNQHGFSGKGSFVWIALKSGFIAHWAIAACLFLLILFFGGLNVFGTGVYIFIKAVALGSFYTLLLWGIVTLPLSLACGFIFWFVAVRGSNNLMAEVFD